MRHPKHPSLMTAWSFRSGRSAQGFTLIELLVVMALLGILIALAAPSFLQFQRNSRLRTVSMSLSSAITAARTEAMKRQRFTFVMPHNGDWNAGWDVFVDMDNDFKLSATDVKLGDQGAQSDQADKPSDLGVTVTAALPNGVNYIMFSGSGFPRTTAGAFLAGTFTMTIAGSGDIKRSVILANTGRMRVCDPNKDTDCKDAGTGN